MRYKQDILTFQIRKVDVLLCIHQKLVKGLRAGDNMLNMIKNIVG